MRSAWPAGPKITLQFPSLHLCVSALIMCAVITLLPCDLIFSRLWQFRWLLCVATKGILAQLGVEMDTEKQRQCGCNGARLTENGNARRAEDPAGF